MSTTPRNPRSARARTQVDDLTNQMASLSVRSGNVTGTGLAYHPCMLGHCCPWDTKHVEAPIRLERTIQRLFETGLVKKCVNLQGRLASEEELLLVHDQAYIDLVRSTMISEDRELEHISKQFDSVYFCDETHKAALMAVGCCLQLVEAICTNKVRNGMALVRPPGHHAESATANGYCIYNNVAITAKYAMNKLGVKKILIVDWDVHHGQATQKTFYDDPRVLCFSMHRYENGAYWPHLVESDYDQIGSGGANGYNVNFPLNDTKLKDQDCITVFNEILMPIALQFSPELVIVSAGFDSAIGDPKGEMSFTASIYNHLTYLLSTLAEGRVLLSLEGGYNPEVLSDCVEASIEALLGASVKRVSYQATPKISLGSIICRSLEMRLWTKPTGMTIRRLHLDQTWRSSRVTQTVLNCASVLHSRWTALDYNFPPANSAVFDWPLHTPEKAYIGALDKNSNEVVHLPPLSPTPPVRNRIHSMSSQQQQALTTALVYDAAMEAHFSFIPHPESPQRHAAIVEQFRDMDLLKECKILESREAELEELLLVHDERYVNRIAQTEKMNNQQLKALETEFRRDVFLNNDTFKCAKIATGSLLQVVDSVVNGESRNGLAIIRPPGHHAESDCAMGFCMFNNVAVAAKYAQTMHGLKKVLIVDWDIHHGNGIQNMFYSDPSVLYISLHRYDNGTFYPSNSDSAAQFIGEGRGAGYNVNIPWNKDKMGNTEYLLAFLKIVLPISQQFNPDLVLVSCGFDAALGDPLGEYRVTSDAYAFMTRLLMTLAGGKVILALEGGYNLRSISDAASHSLKALLGHSPTNVAIENKVSARAWETMRTVRGVLEPHWGCFHGLQKKLEGQQTDLFMKLTPRLLKSQANPKSCPAKISSPGKSVAHSSKASSKTNNNNSEKKKNLMKSATSPSNVQTRAKTNSASAATSSAGQMQLQLPKAADTAASSCQGSDAVNELLMLPQGVSVDASSMYAVEPLPFCPHLETVISPPPQDAIKITSPCLQCSNVGENWICLTCYKVHCGRFVREHGVRHFEESDHSMALSFADLSVWCYTCESYVHNTVLLPIKAVAHLRKFGQQMPS